MAKKQRCGDDLLGNGKGGDVIQKKILVRLPVKSLLRFKVVSKSWFALTESPFFIDLYTTFKPSSQQFGSFIFMASFYKYVECGRSEFEPYGSFQYLKEDSVIMLSKNHDDDNQEDDAADQPVLKVLWKNHDDDDQPFKVDDKGLSDYYKFFSHQHIVGSCNGIICLHDVLQHDHIYLWNPAIRQFKILPKPKPIDIPGRKLPRYLVGFGFDAETNDYKVLRLTAFPPNYYRQASPPIDCLCRLQVYTSSTDSWTLLEGITCLPGFPFFSSYPISTEVVCQNGRCFFLASFFRTKQQLCFPENDRFLISFNFTSYVITPIQLPDHHRHQNLYLSCFGDDKIALFTVGSKLPPRGEYYYPDIYVLPSLPPPSAKYSSYYPKIYQPPRGFHYSHICCCEDYNIWVLDERDGSSSSVNKESWRKLHSFQIEHQTLDQLSSPSCISNDGEFVLLGTAYPIGLAKVMKLYNSVTKEVTKDFLSCNQVMSKAYDYKPSLVKCWAAASNSQQNSQQQPMQ